MSSPIGKVVDVRERIVPRLEIEVANGGSGGIEVAVFRGSETLTDVHLDATGARELIDLLEVALHYERAEAP